MENIKIKVKDYQKLFCDKSPEDIMSFFNKTYQGQLLLASSLGLEDQVLTDMCLKINPNMRIMVLDTGRLPQETYSLMQLCMKTYAMQYEIYFPDAQKVEKMVREKGPNLFYESIENRKQCCYLRKVEPLKRALKTCEAWVTGIRNNQSETRKNAQIIEWDDVHQIIKVNPLIHWSEKDVWAYIKKNKVDYNPLHDQGYPSIGCAPCTRAIKIGEDTRAGRWWWEMSGNKECGLHVVDGKLVRKKND